MQRDADDGRDSDREGKGRCRAPSETGAEGDEQRKGHEELERRGEPDGVAKPGGVTVEAESEDRGEEGEEGGLPKVTGHLRSTRLLLFAFVILLYTFGSRKREYGGRWCYSTDWSFPT